MAKKNNNHIPTSDLSASTSARNNLRRGAENNLRKDTELTDLATVVVDIAENSYAEKSLDLIHELQVHQIELEMQYEELLEAQTELRHTKEEYYNSYELAPVGYLTLNNNGVILKSNFYSAKLLGVEKQFLLNQKITDFIIPEDQDIYYLYKQKLLNDNQSDTCELRLLQDNGNKIWIKMETSVVKDELNNSIHLLTIISDISLRKQEEKTLRENEERLDLVLNVSGKGVWDWDILNDRVKHNDKWY
jgi:PAS domain S-box-containing protein